MRHRREVAVKDLVTYSVLPLLLAAALWVALALLLPHLSTAVKIPVILAATVPGYFLLKRLIIGVVLLYKAFAPLSVRARCRFTPTCSTSMIMAINKYGLLIGLFKGIRRLLRCKPPNGGEDYP